MRLKSNSTANGYDLGYDVERRFIILRDCHCASVFTFDEVHSLETAFTNLPSIVLCQLKSIVVCSIVFNELSNPGRERTRKL